LDRAVRSLRRIYLTINAEDSRGPAHGSTGLSRPSYVDEHPARDARTPEDGNLRHLLYGRSRHRYRIIYAIDEASRVVTVLPIRHGARQAFMPDDPDDEA
jgi:hypothetical protein